MHFYHSAKTSLVCIENTTNKGGGACWNFNDLKEIKSSCINRIIFFFLDGEKGVLRYRGYSIEDLALIQNFHPTILMIFSNSLLFSDRPQKGRYQEFTHKHFRKYVEDLTKKFSRANTNVF